MHPIGQLFMHGVTRVDVYGKSRPSPHNKDTPPWRKSIMP